MSRLTMVTTGPDAVIDQINKQLRKLVDVVDLTDLTEGAHIEREITLVKLELEPQQIPELSAAVRTMGGQVLDDTPGSFTIELAGTGRELDDAIARLTANSRLIELVRSGATAIACGGGSLKIP